jgi:organic hydroperoxide reductase OsmC/OhrA
MSEHRAIVDWSRSEGDFLGGKYSREHTWSFDGGLTVPASPSPFNVPEPYSNAAHIDPEEAFVASISSCHMLTYLYLAYRNGYPVESYRDDAVGVMKENERGARWVAAVTLHPRIRYGGGKAPAAEEEERLHHMAHDGCIIANSVRTEVTICREDPA